MMGYWWVMVAVPLYALLGLLSHKVNAAGLFSGWWWLTWALSIVPLWLVVAARSRNLVFDAMLFDFLLAVGFWIGMVLVAGVALTGQQSVAVILMVIGLVLFQL